MIALIKRHQNSLKAVSLLVGVLVPVLTLSFSGYQYLEANSKLAAQESFKNFHLIVSRIGGGERLDIRVSAANVYELRNYPEYRQFSIRLLKDMEKNWAAGKQDVLAIEIGLTRQYLESL